MRSELPLDVSLTEKYYHLPPPLKIGNSWFWAKIRSIADLPPENMDIWHFGSFELGIKSEMRSTPDVPKWEFEILNMKQINDLNEKLSTAPEQVFEPAFPYWCKCNLSFDSMRQNKFQMLMTQRIVIPTGDTIALTSGQWIQWCIFSSITVLLNKNKGSFTMVPDFLFSRWYLHMGLKCGKMIFYCSHLWCSILWYLKRHENKSCDQSPWQFLISKVFIQQQQCLHVTLRGLHRNIVINYNYIHWMFSSWHI